MFWFHEKIGFAETRRKRAHFSGTFIFYENNGSYPRRDHSLYEPGKQNSLNDKNVYTATR